MIDFIEYVVAELKSKRLSKSNAAALVRQFSRRGANGTAAALHPLLHRNTSDLDEQRFTSTFTGDEPFLADHRVGENKVLPGVAYLEMARAAIEHALPTRPRLVELHNVVWAQPIVVDAKKDVSIALLATEGDAVDFEVFSGDDAVHCQGRAIVAQSAPSKLELEILAPQMMRGTLDATAVYEICSRMGLHYGPSFRSVTSIARGEGQLLAKLRLPSADSECVLPPALLDGALQACIGLIDDAAQLTQPRVPFALDALRVFAPCPGELTAWVRYAPGSSASDSVVKVDLDLCDERGNVCVQLRGFASRVIGNATAVVYAAPAWTADDRELEFAERHVIRCERGEGDLAQIYTDHAIACFEKIQSILRVMPQGRVLVQIVIDDESLSGLAGLLRTATLENPQLIGQLVIHDQPQTLRWQEVPAGDAPVAFQQDGVYLITGGRGALGTLFAREIENCGAKAIRAGRADFDLQDRASVDAFIASIVREHGRLDGILHAAGRTADDFLLKKSAAQFRDVLAPKVTGTVNLDAATQNIPLDFFVLFAAAAGALGNLGQADYATANAFLDSFAAQRNRLVAAGARQGRTRAIDWPLWEEGGLGVDAANRERLRDATGMHAMQTATGIAAFHRALALPHDQLLVVEGDATQIRRALLSAPAAVVEASATAPASIDAETAEEFLRKEFADVIKVPAATIDPRAALELYGIDSILAMKLTNRLEQTFGSLPKTLFFEYQTLRELTNYFVTNHASSLVKSTSTAVAVTTPPPQPPAAKSRRRSRITNHPTPITSHPTPITDNVAIIGLSGRYPEAIDVDAYWQNLRDGKDCIVEVPKSRWDWREYYTDDRTETGRHYSKWGGFIEGVDEFDPLFFNISPVDAELMDPQERLFLQHAWMAVEDAGYTRASMQIAADDDLPGQAGVYVGVMYTEYQLFGDRRRGIVGSFASVANRVSYALNLHGPSMTIDTMCSSSLTAIHIACQDLRQGRTSLAIAGGVNVTVHPNKYLILSDGQFLSGDGHCQSFGEGGDGYIPGEGVGVVVLKRLSDAQRDGDHIYGIIRGSSLNHGGKTNGYSVPNPQAQSTAISRALAEAKIDARHISYIEAHGTGTKLGDPIEIAALQKAFARDTQDTQFCLIGSAKSNIGHCESAAGIAGLTKVLLQMQHRQIVPSLHSAQLNPHIDFAKTPFTVNQELRPWDAPVIDGRTLPRIAGLSSFGAGGSNAHMLIEEPMWSAATPVAAVNGPHVIVLSARTPEQLDQKVRDLLAHLRTHADLDLAALAYTLQVGREPMDERLAFVVTSLDDLIEKLSGDLAGAHRGTVKRNNETLALFANDADLQQAIDRWIASRKLPKLLDLWVKGLELDWNKLYADAKPRRISLPVYPFARERYWIDTTSIRRDAPVAAIAAATLHPLLHVNTSDLTEQRYSSTFTGDEFFLADHQVASNKVLPGVAVLEMARAAIEQAVPQHDATLELRNVVWAQPVLVDGPTPVHIALLANDDGSVDYEIYGDDETVHGQGQASFTNATAPHVDLDALRARMTANARTPDELYATYARIGLAYGPSFRTIRALHRGNGEVLAELRSIATSEFVLHPSVLDGALQSAISLVDGDLEPRVPFALDTVRVLAPCTEQMFAWVRVAASDKLDVDLCDASGNVCVQLHGFVTRALAARTGSIVASAVWEASEDANETFAEEHVFVCEPRADGTLAERYTTFATQCFEQTQSILRRKPQERVRFRIVAEEPLFAGLSALLKTAALENPNFVGELVLDGRVQTLRWQEVPAHDAPVAFEKDHVYLLTGGHGALGSIFAREIEACGGKAIRAGRADFDLLDRASVEAFVDALVREHGRLDGVLHCAGTLADHLIINKTAVEFRDVLAPKVLGTENLDHATRALDLDFFVLFSSLAGAVGNAGQADYASANAFLDRFAAHRNAQVAAGERRGRTVSIDWPQWQDGGMDVDASRLELLAQTLGMHPLQTATGVQAFHRALASSHDQLLVVEGDVAKLRRALLATPSATAATRITVSDAALVEKTRGYLRKELSTLLKMPPQKIDPQAALEDYGIDSILAMKLTNQLEKAFGSLPKTLFFEYQNLHDLAGYFAANHESRITTLFNTQPPTAKTAPPKAATPLTRRRPRITNHQSPNPTNHIAIIGLSGRYPQALDVEAYWRNLRDGKDCITEVPKSRWDWREYLTKDGGHASKWGGFIEGVDEFDPLFFHMTPLEAEFMDPQERLFLQHVWLAIEDAGYTRASLQTPSDDDLPGQAGVYAGVMYSEYQLFGAEAGARGKRLGLPGSTASIANRVSYALNLHGPSVTLDTMCSSSLTAIHFACQDLKLGRTSIAIAGGVNVTIHPNKYLVLSSGQFISGDGHCQSFGEGGDGYIPGEGVGVVVLKRLADAERDGDPIYGIIRGSSLNHGGKTNGYTVPNPQAQATAIRRALVESRTNARHVSYIEAHGTGTKLGDPIEIAALSKAFARDTQDTQFCLIGSAKSNIGHCESAAGIAGLTKVLLQMQHKQIVPSLHSAQLNPNIDFPNTPFTVNQELRPWDAPVVDGRTLPCIAGLSSFGAGGSNAHLIIEEYVWSAATPVTAADTPHAILLSARTPEQLDQRVRDLLAHLRTHPELDLASIAYTLQAGRESMTERLGLIVTSLDDLIVQLEHGLAGAYRGRIDRNTDLSLFTTDADLQQTVDKWLAHGKLANLLDLWTKGLEPDWSRLHGERKPRRVSLPAYPFARERYWIDTAALASVTPHAAQLHPLLHSNTSDLTEQRYTSTFTGAEFFFADHQVQGRKILPAVAYLEMARAALAQALPDHDATLELRDVVWARPLIVDARTEVRIALSPRDENAVDFTIFTGEDVVHCEGSAVLHNEPAPAPLDLHAAGELVPSSEIYAACTRIGLVYGPSFQSIVGVQREEDRLLAQLRLPEGVADDAYGLHPSLLDGALQSCVALLSEIHEPRVPFALDTLRVFAPCTREMVASVRAMHDRIDIDLCDVSGNVCVQLRGLATRAIQLHSDGVLYAAPVWQTRAVEPSDVETRRIVLDGEGTVAQRYTDYALTCFAQIRDALESPARVRLQFVVAQQPEQAVFAGLSALLQTARRENPRLDVQLLLANDEVIVRWEEVPEPSDAPIAFKKNGVYLISGGRGGLGTIFAAEIEKHGATAIRAGRNDFDLLDRASVESFIDALVREHGRLDGVLHCAGTHADHLIANKSEDEFRGVLAPKVTGTVHLDEATRDLDLDFFVLFSSVASATGNAGQSDYATANAFLDRFAAHRNAQVAAGLRKGRTRSILWPLWQSGGMTVDAETQERLAESTGMRAMQTATGIDAFHRILAMPHDNVLVAEGDRTKMRRLLAPEVRAASSAPIASDDLQTKTQDWLRREFASVLKLSYQKIDASAPLEDYGIDSILAMKLTAQLEETFGSLSKTLFFEYQTIAALAKYFVANHAGQLSAVIGTSAKAEALPPHSKTKPRRRITNHQSPITNHIAIIGLGGRYPQANNLLEFWRNLRDGRDCITEVPSDRWNHELYFDADPNKAGKSYSKWGGFLADVDKFDPLFFSISPKEAELLDPQERLFLETAWETLEDAGYTKDSVSGTRVGVYVGVMWGQYELYGADAMARGAAAFPGSSYASIANRVSYFFDFHGPSIALDTMCSSSLTAIHLACDALRKGEIDAAIAGGVNVTVHPYKYLSLSQGKFAATDGRCRAFGAGGDGYVPGEGVGAVLLKPLDAALRDGDQIYATIKSTAINHGGKTNGYSVPNPNAQGDLIADALRKADVDPRTLSYVETHGTGTSLGDPIEITGLMKAFGSTEEKQFCPIGSVKSNIGHLESAAGIAAITKSLLQLRYDQLVPSLHATPLNPNIDFASSPFYVQTELAEWKRTSDRPRRIGVSSFGAGGANAHVILEEFVTPSRVTRSSSQPEVFVLSAKNDAALRRYAQRVSEFLDAVSDLSLSDVAYTSQVGRTPMDSRLVILTSSIDELRAKLAQWLGGAQDVDDVFHANVRDAQISTRQLFGGQTGSAFLEGLLANRELEKLAQLWVSGVDVDWSRMRDDASRRRVSLPTYPFARERHWIAQSAAPVAPVLPVIEKHITYYAPEWTPKATGARGSLTTDVVLHGATLPLDGVHCIEGGLLPLFEFLRERTTPVRIVSVVTNPLDAAIAGFLRTFVLENPSCAAKVIDIDGGDLASIVREELSEADWTNLEIRYRDGARLVSELQPRALAPNKELPLRERGVYLITGGMGGLGLLFAKHLAKQYRARLVLVGRSEADANKLRQLESLGAEVLHVRADVAKYEDVELVVAEAKSRFGAIHGVIHSAGITRDSLAIHKTVADLDAVLAPKVQGAMHLDRATADEPLDFFVLFSSIASVVGNPGQSDYAYANRYLDAFAQTRRGRTLSINWPFWQDGGMEMSRETIERLERQTGMTPLPTSEGIRAFEELLRTDLAQGVVFYGTPKPQRAAVKRVEGETLNARTEAYLKEMLGAELKLSSDRIGSHDPLESFGIDSVMINKLNAQLEQDLGALPKTLFYEHETVHALTTFLVVERHDALVALFGNVVEAEAPVLEQTIETPLPIEVRSTDDRVDEPIAIVGVHGWYPQSPNLEAYWENLKHGRDLIELVPADRWNADELYHPDPAAAADGKVYCKWGGFVADHDKFDPHFFKIPTAEAKLIDPQERMFLESVWAAIEDAGYTRESLRARHGKAGSANIGVYVGVTTNSYQLWAPEERTRGNFVAPTAMPWSIANRVSYFFDFNGPSLPIDTACSSSLVAIHLACESLRSGDCQVAVAGGVNLYLHPAKYHSLCSKRMVSLDGKTHSYGAGDDGFVPGEGVGTIVLKPLSKAIADGDHVYGVIRASAFDHSGRSNGYSAPNPNAQANLISRTLEKAGIHPDSISYVEGHGTGTQLGDSLEIAALTKAFRNQTTRKQYCPIGSVKANLGHSESAAGIAGVAKVLLQLEHRQLAPSIHSDVVNPNIEFDDSPFYLQHALSEWPSSQGPRRALINSFGAGGVNACVVIEEYEAPRTASSPHEGPYLFTLSAKNEERLREYAGHVAARLYAEPNVDLASFCFTFQSGREAMEERLATVVDDVRELADRLSDWSERGWTAGVQHGSLGPRRGARRSVKIALGEQTLEELAAKWIAGEDVDWTTLHPRGVPRKLSAPTYPFARERYWVSDDANVDPPAQSPAQLHPLVAYNSSTLKEVSFTSVLSDEAFYAVDHKVHDASIFPGAGFLEMACIAANVAGEQRVRKIKDVVWIAPLAFRNGPQSLRTVLRHAGETVEYAISSLDDDNESVLHSEGRLAFVGGGGETERIAIAELQSRCARSEDGDAFYDKFREFGLHYGASFRTVQELHLGGAFALAKLKIADHLRGDFRQYLLHPSIIDGALQTVAGLVGNVASRTPYVPFALDEVEILAPVPQVCWAYAERAEDSDSAYAGVSKFHIRLLSESGEVLIRFTNLYVRPLPQPAAVLALSGNSFQ